MLLEFVMGNFVLFCLGLSGVVVGAALWGGLPNENCLLYTSDAADE